MKNIQKNPMFKGLMGALILLILALIIGKYFFRKKLDYIIDNPTDKSIQVKIDKKLYTIEPQSFLIIDLSKGKHLLNDKITFDNSNTDQGVINPTHTTYYIYTKFYGTINKKDSLDKILKNINYSGKNYQKTDTTSAYFIHDFYYNLHESYPKYTNAKRDSLHNDSRLKIFRQEDFRDEYESL